MTSSGKADDAYQSVGQLAEDVPIVLGPAGVLGHYPRRRSSRVLEGQGRPGGRGQ